MENLRGDRGAKVDYRISGKQEFEQGLIATRERNIYKKQNETD